MEREQYWIFTFGCGQPHYGHYVRIWGTRQSAKEEMIRRHGTKWSMQYTHLDWVEFIKRFHGPVETELIKE